MEKVQWNSITKKYNGLEILNTGKMKNYTGFARALAYLSLGSKLPKAWMNYLATLLHLYSIHCL